MEVDRKVGTNLLISGVIVFLIGMYSGLIIGRNGNIQILGLLLQGAGGILAIYGFMILLEEYVVTGRPPTYPGMHEPSPHSPLVFIDREMKKIIGIVMIAALLVYILSPGMFCSSWIFFLLFLAVIFLILRGGQRPLYPPPLPYYPPPQPAYQPPASEAPVPPQSSKVTLCKNCYAQLELDWAACPFCGQHVP